MIETDLKKKNLIQVKMNRYSIDFVFECDILIIVGHKLRYLKGDTKTLQQWDWVNNQQIALNDLLEKPVSYAEVDQNENLILIFDDQSEVIIEAEKGDHESYIIHNKKECQVVW